MVLNQWCSSYTFGVSCRENLLGQIPRICVSMAFLCSKPLERTKLSGVQNHSPKFGGIFWVVGNYPKWRLREKVQKKRAKILSMSGLDFGRERFVQLRGCPWHPQCLPCLVQMRFGRSHPRTGRFFCSADRAFFSAEKSGLTFPSPLKKTNCNASIENLCRKHSLARTLADSLRDNGAHLSCRNDSSAC